MMLPHLGHFHRYIGGYRLKLVHTLLRIAKSLFFIFNNSSHLSCPSSLAWKRPPRSCSSQQSIGQDRQPQDCRIIETSHTRGLWPLIDKSYRKIMMFILGDSFNCTCDGVWSNGKAYSPHKHFHGSFAYSAAHMGEIGGEYVAKACSHCRPKGTKDMSKGAMSWSWRDPVFNAKTRMIQNFITFIGYIAGLTVLWPIVALIYG